VGAVGCRHDVQRLTHYENVTNALFVWLSNAYQYMVCRPSLVASVLLAADLCVVSAQAMADYPVL
jgi:hypothetical protein